MGGIGGTLCPISFQTAFTSAHVTDEFQKANRWEWHSGLWKGNLSLVWRDPSHDISLVRSDTAFPRWSVAVKRAPETGAALITLGRTEWLLDLPGKMILPGSYIGLDSGGFIVATGPSYPGNSGGCVLDENGLLVGVNWGSRGWTGRPAVPTSMSTPVWVDHSKHRDSKAPVKHQ